MRTYREPTDLDRAALRAMGHRLPKGCDQQGRYPEAAEAATDVGADDTRPGEGSGALIWPIAVAAVGAAAWIVFGGEIVAFLKT